MLDENADMFFNRGQRQGPHQYRYAALFFGIQNKEYCLENQRFSQLGIGKRGEETEAISYGQIEASLEGLCDLLGAAGFFLSLLPEERDTRPLLIAGSILTKITPALRELDMGYDWATESIPVPDGKGWMSRQVHRYR